MKTRPPRERLTSQQNEGIANYAKKYKFKCPGHPDGFLMGALGNRGGKQFWQWYVYTARGTSRSYSLLYLRPMGAVPSQSTVNTRPSKRQKLTLTQQADIARTQASRRCRIVQPSNLEDSTCPGELVEESKAFGNGTRKSATARCNSQI